MWASKLTSWTYRWVSSAKPFSQSHVVRGISSTQDPIVLTKDGSVYVAWHPPKPIAYEMTREMPKVEAQPPSVLKTDDFSAVMKPQKQHAIIEELAKATYTTKHRWYPQGNRFRRKRENEQKLYQKEDREYM